MTTLPLYTPPHYPTGGYPVSGHLCSSPGLLAASLALPWHTHTQAGGCQELPSLSVDFEMEFAILNRPGEPTGTYWKAPPSLSFPPCFWIEAFFHCRGSVSTAVCWFQKKASQDCGLRP